MVRRRKPRALSPRYARRWPVVIVWACGLGAATSTLLGLAYLVASGPPQHDVWILDEVLHTVAMTGVTVAVAVTALTTMAWCFRHVWFDWVAWRPGRIEVDTFTAGSDLTDADVAQLTLRFRQRLADLRLQAPTPVPGATSEGDFLEVLGHRGVDSRNWLGSALSLLRAAKPTHTWQVNGVLVERHEAPRFGLTVQVLRLPDQGNPPKTYWGNRWDEVIRLGAADATAAILPRTRLCRTPWATWRRFVLPGELLGLYEDAVGLERARRYDEALDAYYRASALDPMNMALRLRIGQLQERLALHLDALSTYEAMLVVGRQRPRVRTVLVRRAARSERRRALMAARYRRIVLLGGSDLVEQWRKTGPTDKQQWTERDRRRKELRDLLRRQLAGELSRVLSLHPTAGSDSMLTAKARRSRRRPRRSDQTPEVLLSEPSPAPRTEAQRLAEERRVFGLRELFALAALDDADAMLLLTRARLRDRQLLLTPDSLKLTAECVRVRLDWIQHKLAGGNARCWPPDPAKLDEDIGRIEARWGFNRWHEHYNAACVYALPLMADPSTDQDEGQMTVPVREALAERAVARLATATAHADSAYMAGRRDWLLSEDPDLDGLRAHPRFKDFEAIYFPADVPTARRPRHVQLLENARYLRDLLVATAERWEQAWHERSRKLDHDADVHTVLSWCGDESEAWDLVRSVALNYRNSGTRLQLLHRMSDWGNQYGFKPLEIPFPRYDREPLEHAGGQTNRGEHWAREAAEAAATRLGMIAETVRETKLDEPPRPTLTDIECWQAALRELDMHGRSPRRFVLAPLCDRHAALWQLLQEWLVAEADEVEDKGSAFEDHVRRTARMWRSARAWWRNPAFIVAAARDGRAPAVMIARSVIRLGETKQNGRSPERPAGRSLTR